jgi:heme-degrading monooxygenase HmoA
LIQVMWEFVVKPEATRSFEQAYRPGGEWSRLFEHCPGYQGTMLMQDTEDPRRYVTIDTWETAEQQKAAVERAQYSQLDRALAHLMESEQEIGVFEAV